MPPKNTIFPGAFYLNVTAIIGQDAEIPCELTPHTKTDNAYLVLWYKDIFGTPIYRYKLTKKTMAPKNFCFKRIPALICETIRNIGWRETFSTNRPVFLSKKRDNILLQIKTLKLLNHFCKLKKFNGKMPDFIVVEWIFFKLQPET
jgi:hypothetical protein